MPTQRIAFVSICLGGLLAGIAGPAFAADDPRSCAGIDDDAARLACYDRAVGRVAPARATPPATGAAPPPGPAAVVPAAAAVAPAAAAKAAPTAVPTSPAAAVAGDPVADFGLREGASPERAPAKPAAPESVVGKITGIRYRKYGEFVVTLDNGQVWEQNEPQPSAVVRVGDTVTVKKAALGSYMLVTSSRVGTKVRRVQ